MEMLTHCDINLVDHITDESDDDGWTCQHTGGGCHWFSYDLDAETRIVVTDADAYLPELGGVFTVGVYAVATQDSERDAFGGNAFYRGEMLTDEPTHVWHAHGWDGDLGKVVHYVEHHATTGEMLGKWREGWAYNDKCADCQKMNAE